MKAQDKLDVIEAIQIYTAPVLAEIRAYRAEVAAYREEALAHAQRMELRFEEHDRDIGAIMKRLFPEE